MIGKNDMEYEGKLYGKIDGKYFDTGKTSDDWDELKGKARQDESVSSSIIEVEINDNFDGGKIRMDNDLYDILTKYKGKVITARTKELDVLIAIKE